MRVVQDSSRDEVFPVCDPVDCSGLGDGQGGVKQSLVRVVSEDDWESSVVLKPGVSGD